MVGDEKERAHRLAQAVALVQRGDSCGRKVSVRRAAAMYGVPKSTVHRHIQANRGSLPRRARASSHKLHIGFLVHADVAP